MVKEREMNFPNEWFQDEVRDGFYISGMVKRDWASQLEILHTLDEVCTRHHLRWFMAFGALLGTVRHNGFIPWDDDLDIFMPSDDFESFCKAVKKELPANYYVDDCCNRKSHGFISVFGYQYRDGYGEKEMRQFHDFPYQPSIDIFRLDYVSSDPLQEAWRDECVRKVMSVAAYLQGEITEFPKPDFINSDTVTLQDLAHLGDRKPWADRARYYLLGVETATSHSFQKNEPILDQVYALLKKLFLYFPEKSCRKMAFLVSYINRGVQCFPKEYADHLLRVPFENTKVNIPKEYREVLLDRFGPDYMKYYKGAATHAYPGFRKFEKTMLSANGMQDENPFVYSFITEDLKPRQEDRSTPKKSASHLLELLQKFHQDLHAAARSGSWQSCFDLYHLCETTALQLGTVIRNARDTECLKWIPVSNNVEAVTNCFIYSLQHQPLKEKDLEPADSALLHLEEALKKHFLNRKEVVFLPTTLRRWKAMESLWHACCEDPDCDVTVIPIPYYYKDGLCGIRKPSICEREQFPAYVHAEDYKTYRLAAHHPDYIFIQSPYDQYNYVTTVAPEYYSEALYSITDHLVYIPWFKTCEFRMEDLDSVPMDFYAKMPGVVRSDLSIVQSEAIRSNYIESLTAFAGKETRSIWEKKIQGWGSPLEDADGSLSPLWDRIREYFDS